MKVEFSETCNTHGRNIKEYFWFKHLKEREHIGTVYVAQKLY